MRDALELAMDNLRPHGDNCFLHDEGEYNACFCGKDSLVDHLQSVVENAALIAANAVRQPQFVGCAYYESNGACCESGEPCKADVQNNAAVQAQWHLPEKREIGEFDPKKSDSTYFRGLGWNECIDAMSSMQPPAAP
jgi:hypothetical protein